jgi:cytochrome c556
LASVQELKAGLAQAAGEAQTVTTQARAGADAVDRMIMQLQAVGQGTGHPKIAEAVAKAQEAKQRFAEAAQLAQAAAQAAKDYMGVLG